MHSCSMSPHGVRGLLRDALGRAPHAPAGGGCRQGPTGGLRFPERPARIGQILRNGRRKTRPSATSCRHRHGQAPRGRLRKCPCRKRHVLRRERLCAERREAARPCAECSGRGFATRRQGSLWPQGARYVQRSKFCHLRTKPRREHRQQRLLEQGALGKAPSNVHEVEHRELGGEREARSFGGAGERHADEGDFAGVSSDIRRTLHVGATCLQNTPAWSRRGQ
mmetsp:Transcript_22456/g.72728  ORF Transcript_22456/g.72728 Transcript_22456/m.72728 type:complete len:223 (+) Transcript_22456:254-922(+)